MITTFIEKKDHWIIRIHSIEGFRWFKTTDKINKVLKAIEAKKIESELMIDGMKSKYAFITPIII